MVSGFPKRVYTVDEFERARKLVQSGHKHRLVVKGGPLFKKKVKEALKHIKKCISIKIMFGAVPVNTRAAL